MYPYQCVSIALNSLACRNPGLGKLSVVKICIVVRASSVEPASTAERQNPPKFVAIRQNFQKIESCPLEMHWSGNRFRGCWRGMCWLVHSMNAPVMVQLSGETDPLEVRWQHEPETCEVHRVFGPDSDDPSDLWTGQGVAQLWRIHLVKWQNGKLANWQFSSMSIVWRDTLSLNIFSFGFHTPICFEFSDSFLILSPSVCVLVSKLKVHAWTTPPHSFPSLTHYIWYFGYPL